MDEFCRPEEFFMERTKGKLIATKCDHVVLSMVLDTERRSCSGGDLLESDFHSAVVYSPIDSMECQNAVHCND